MGFSQAQQTSVTAAGREEAVLRVAALGREAVPKVSASVRQRNYSVKKLYCSMDVIYICLRPNCTSTMTPPKLCILQIQKAAATFQTTTKQNRLNPENKVFIKSIFKKDVNQEV